MHVLETCTFSLVYTCINIYLHIVVHCSYLQLCTNLWITQAQVHKVDGCDGWPGHDPRPPLHLIRHQGPPDTSQVDQGSPDTSQVDQGSPDTSQVDQGSPDTSQVDHGSPDTSWILLQYLLLLVLSLLVLVFCLGLVAAWWEKPVFSCSVSILKGNLIHLNEATSADCFVRPYVLTVSLLIDVSSSEHVLR